MDEKELNKSVCACQRHKTEVLEKASYILIAICWGVCVNKKQGELTGLAAPYS